MVGMVCGICGVEVAQKRDGAWVHADSLPEKEAPHDVDTVVSVKDFVFGETQRQEAATAPRDLQLALLERQTVALEELVALVRYHVHRMDI